jgi:hypothetical protein
MLELYSNMLTNAIPSELGQLTRIGFSNYASGMLGLFANSLTGSIPSELGRLTLMKSGFYLNSNSLTGAIPSELGKLTRTTGYFYLHSNSLTGTIPSQLGRFTSVTTNLYLYSNMLCGDVPPEVATLSAKVTSGWNVVTGNLLGKSCATPKVKFLVLCLTSIHYLGLQAFSRMFSMCPQNTPNIVKFKCCFLH